MITFQSTKPEGGHNGKLAKPVPREMVLQGTKCPLMAVSGLDVGVGQLVVEGVEDAFPVVLEALGDLFDRLDAAASSPAVPSLQQGLGTGAIGGGVEDLAQRYSQVRICAARPCPAVRHHPSAETVSPSHFKRFRSLP
jgi:hypothetical protein